MPIPLSQSFIQDLAAMDFERVPVAVNAEWHDFQRGGTVIRFWENVGVRAAWSHVVYASASVCSDALHEVVTYSGAGLTRLAVYLHGGR